MIPLNDVNMSLSLITFLIVAGIVVIFFIIRKVGNRVDSLHSVNDVSSIFGSNHFAMTRLTKKVESMHQTIVEYSVETSGETPLNSLNNALFALEQLRKENDQPVNYVIDEKVVDVVDKKPFWRFWK